jgi:hypothetical protein
LRGIAHKTDPRNLMRTKGRVFGFQINNELAHVFREPLPRISRGRCFGKQAHHAVSLKLVRLVVQRAFRDPGFFRAGSGRLAKQHNGAQALVLLLFRPERLLLNRLPVMGACAAFTTATGHRTHLIIQKLGCC